jgi:hypothetical protein
MVKSRVSPKKVLSLSKQKIKAVAQNIKRKMAVRRAENLYERLIGIKPTRTIQLSPRKSPKRKSPRPSMRM